MSYVKQDRLSTVEYICRRLENDILSLYYAPGEKLTENDLAIRYGVSRNTLREASAHLVSLGYLTKVANKGLSVRCFTPEDVKEIFHLRTLLEAEALQNYSEQTDLNGLYLLASQMEQTDRNRHWDTYVLLDIDFHYALVKAAGSPRLCKLYETILTEVKLCIFQTREYVTVPQATPVSHRDILDSIASGNIPHAQELLTSHIRHVILRYCAGLQAMDRP